MGSRHVQLPDSLVPLDRFEVKLDSLAQKLDAHLARAETGTTRGCPACLTCSTHDEKHRAMDRRVEAQAELLDRLEKRTVEILGMLERMVKGV